MKGFGKKVNFMVKADYLMINQLNCQKMDLIIETYLALNKGGFSMMDIFIKILSKAMD